MESWHTTNRPVDLDDAPPLGAILSYRTVYLLCTASEKDGHMRLRATHYTACLVAGRSPIWGVWTVAGVFQRFFPRKERVAAAYPKLVWRAKQSTWSLADVHDKAEDDRRHELETIYVKGKPVTGHEIDTILAAIRPPADNVVRLRA